MINIDLHQMDLMTGIEVRSFMEISNQNDLKEIKGK